MRQICMTILCILTVTFGFMGAPEANDKPIGVGVDAGLASAYLFRGLNVFGDKQADQNAGFFPSITYSLPGTGFSLSYWGAFQLNGDNRGDKVDVGAGMEQDLVLGYAWTALDDKLALKASLTAYVFPFADEDLAGANVPLYLEPGITGVYATRFVDVGLQVAYFAAVQEELELYRYLYVRPTLSKSLQLTKHVTESVVLGYGYKWFNDRDQMKDNVHDVSVDLETNISLGGTLYLKPALRGGWTNLTGKSLGDELVFLFSVNLGMSF